MKTLATSSGAEVVHSVLQTRVAPEAATLVGSGKVEEIARDVTAMAADLVVFDHELTPTQARNLEGALSCKVLDRTQLILDIFARRARTREGKLQVELAQLNYLLPRLAGRGIEMSRLGGGIGTRGPGETQLETDRRRIFRRIRKLERDLENVRAGRGVHRRQRQGVPLATVALVGYTNAGKSTLFNRLTGADVLADPRMFATLDPTVRAIQLPSNRRALLSDTVGFIRSLPTTLVKAFRATLEEVAEAALLLHLVDVSSAEAVEHTSHVVKVLSEIGAGQTPQIVVLNKSDLLPEGDADAGLVRERVLAGNSQGARAPAITVSARTGKGIDGLLHLIDELLPIDPIRRLKFRFNAGEGALLGLLHDYSRVLSVRYIGNTCEVEADAPDTVGRRLSEYVVRESAVEKHVDELSGDGPERGQPD